MLDQIIMGQCSSKSWKKIETDKIQRRHSFNDVMDRQDVDTSLVETTVPKSRTVAQIWVRRNSMQS